MENASRVLTENEVVLHFTDAGEQRIRSVQLGFGACALGLQRTGDQADGGDHGDIGPEQRDRVGSRRSCREGPASEFGGRSGGERDNKGRKRASERAEAHSGPERQRGTQKRQW